MFQLGNYVGNEGIPQDVKEQGQPVRYRNYGQLSISLSHLQTLKDCDSRCLLFMFLCVHSFRNKQVDKLCNCLLHLFVCIASLFPLKLHDIEEVYHTQLLVRINFGNK